MSTSAAVATRAGGDGGTERGWAARAAARAEPSQTGAKPHRANRLDGQTVMGVRIETEVTPRPRLGRRGGLGGRRARRARASDAAGWWATVHRTCRHPKSEATREVVNPNASMARTPTDRDGRRRRRESELPTALSPRLSRRHKGPVGAREWWERGRAARLGVAVLESQDCRSRAHPAADT